MLCSEVYRDGRVGDAVDAPRGCGGVRPGAMRLHSEVLRELASFPHLVAEFDGVLPPLRAVVRGLPVRRPEVRGVTVRAQDLKTRLPEDMFWEIREMHPLLTPKLTNATIKRAVRDYLNGGARKQRVVTKYGEIRNWDVSNVEDMENMFQNARSFNQPLHAPWYHEDSESE